MTREDFLRNIKWATIVDHSPYVYADGVKEIALTQVFGLVSEQKCCPCGFEYTLTQNTVKSRAAEEERK